MRGFATGDQTGGMLVDEFVPAGEVAHIMVVWMGAVGSRPGVAFVDHG